MLNKLQKATNDFKSSDLNLKTQQEVDNLKSLINAVANIQVDKNVDSNALNAYDALRNKLIQQANSILQAFKQLQEGNQQGFNENASSNPSELKELDNLLNSKKYFDIKEKIGLNQSLTKQEKEDTKTLIDQLAKISESENNVPNILIDVIKNELNKADLSENTLPWWPFLVAVSGLLWLAGLAFILLKK
ncbi:hypothetical protein FIV53_00555 [Mycoplasma nasistruthionis]|uniref:Protein G-related albumin-binding (GA) module domain-containing protein n=1 Tax=Mycoplasma nasistruthionis TaxID=353852 RepID=A0A4Y6I672_9MOLU|nr:hypothetical protein FIV53_00555 [Mycoplasma nasistruthionis]